MFKRTWITFCSVLWSGQNWHQVIWKPPSRHRPFRIYHKVPDVMVRVTHWILVVLYTGGWFNIKMSSYQYRKYHYLHNGISYTGKTTSLYWIRALIIIDHCYVPYKCYALNVTLTWKGYRNIHTYQRNKTHSAFHCFIIWPHKHRQITIKCIHVCKYRYRKIMSGKYSIFCHTQRQISCFDEWRGLNYSIRMPKPS